jgi:KDO2-lipid IV(A) lauroyltransferase
MERVRRHIVWLLQYWALRVVQCLLLCFPIDANLATARIAGDLLYLLDKRHREIALRNLRASFPEKGEAELRRIARESFQHMIMVGVEVLCMPRLVQFNSFTHHVEMEPGTLRALGLIVGGPYIIVGGHYGNWEISTYFLSTMGLPPVSVGRPLDNPYLDRHIRGIRERSGQRIISKFGMTREAVGLLRQGRGLAFPADQDAGRRGFFVDFFGRKASVYKSIAYLALQERVPIIVGATYRAGKRFHYRANAIDVIDPAEYEVSRDGALAITQRYTEALERLIRIAPGQYLWVHRRWKTRPPEERKARRAAGLPEKDK